MIYSKKWKNWKAIVDYRTCVACKNKNGTIYSINEIPSKHPPIHYNCRCIIEIMQSIFAGTATEDGMEGADWYIKNLNKLPNYYITKSLAKRLGWEARRGNLDIVAPGKTIFGGIYYNKDKKLPSAPGRIWFEADINYSGGKRNTERLLFSNDGLIFVTYDHYATFYEII